MKCLIVRSLTLKEIRERLNLFEKKYGSLESLGEQIFKNSTDRWGDYVEWLELLHAYRDYEETGSLEYFVEEEVPVKVLRKLLSNKTYKMLNEIERENICISELARRLKRSIPNVYKDLKLLKKYRVVDFWRRGKKLIPYLLVEKIVIQS